MPPAYTYTLNAKTRKGTIRIHISAKRITILRTGESPEIHELQIEDRIGSWARVTLLHSNQDEGRTILLRIPASEVPEIIVKALEVAKSIKGKEDVIRAFEEIKKLLGSIEEKLLKEKKQVAV